MDGVGYSAAAASRRRRAPADRASCRAGRQARSRPVADSHRVDWRVTQHARLFPTDRRQHHPWRFVHVAPEHQPARNSRLRLRRVVAIRDAAAGGSVCRGRRGADRQDRRVGARVLQRVRRHSQANPGRRIRQGATKRRTEFPRRLRDHRRSARSTAGASRAGPARRRVLDLRPEGDGRDACRGGAGDGAVHPAVEVPGRRGRATGPRSRRRCGP